MQTITLTANPTKYAYYAGRAKSMESNAWAAHEEDQQYADLNESPNDVLLFESERSPLEYTEHTTQVVTDKDTGPKSYSRDSRYVHGDNASKGFHEGFEDTDEGRVFTFHRKARNPDPTSYMIADGTVTLLEE